MGTNVNIDELLAKMTEFLKNEAKIESIIGQPFKLGEYECVPVMRIGFGLGGGGGEGSTGTTNGGGVAAGVGMGPVGFLVSRGNEINFIPIKQGALSSAIDKIPGLLETILDRTKKTDKVEKTEKAEKKEVK
jgi:uncharacterized spore protein YtfJ